MRFCACFQWFFYREKYAHANTDMYIHVCTRARAHTHTHTHTHIHTDAPPPPPPPHPHIHLSTHPHTHPTHPTQKHTPSPKKGSKANLTIPGPLNSHSKTRFGNSNEINRAFQINIPDFNLNSFWPLRAVGLHTVWARLFAIKLCCCCLLCQANPFGLHTVWARLFA